MRFPNSRTRLGIENVEKSPKYPVRRGLADIKVSHVPINYGHAGAQTGESRVGRLVQCRFLSEHGHQTARAGSAD